MRRGHKEIKSWHIIGTGILLELFHILFIVLGIVSGSLKSFGYALELVIFIIGTGFSMVPFFLLLFEKTRIIGGVLSLALGIVFLAGWVYFLFYGVMSFVGPFLFAGGLYWAVKRK